MIKDRHVWRIKQTERTKCKTQWQCRVGHVFQVWEASVRTGRILWDEIIFWRQKKKDLIDSIVIHIGGPQSWGLFLQPVCILFTHSGVIISEKPGSAGLRLNPVFTTYCLKNVGYTTGWPYVSGSPSVNGVVFSPCCSVSGGGLTEDT